MIQRIMISKPLNNKVEEVYNNIINELNKIKEVESIVISLDEECTNMLIETFEKDIKTFKKFSKQIYENETYPLMELHFGLTKYSSNTLINDKETEVESNYEISVMRLLSFDTPRDFYKTESIKLRHDSFDKFPTKEELITSLFE